MESYYLGGICGMGMAPLALLLKDSNNRVFGFDDCVNEGVASMLKAQGIELFEGYNSSIKADNFIISTALLGRDFSGREFRQRGQCFADFCKERKLVAIVGSHGKTSVSNMCAYLLNSLGISNIGYMLGAMPSGNYLPAKNCAKGEYIIAEVDESDATIENFSPEICCALNFDLDHTNTYAGKAEMLAMFERLFARTKSKILVPKNSKELCEIAEKSGKAYIIVDTNNRDFDCFNKSMAKRLFEEIIGKEIGENALENFTGTQRRQEVLADNPSHIAIGDYAHHPSEVEAFLDWLNAKQSEKKIIFFQPHRYSRTKQFHAEFKNILLAQSALGAKIYILPVYPASEAFDPLGTSELISNSNTLELISFEDMKSLINTKINCAKEKLCLAFIGAGDIYFKAKGVFAKDEKF